ncbi:MAG: peptidylprolyl isomerase [bacterium]
MSRFCHICVLVVSLLPPAGCQRSPPEPDSCGELEPAPFAAPELNAGDALWMIEAGRPARSAAVLDLLGHPNPRARQRAALAAGRLASPSLVRRALKLLGDEEPEVRAAAAWAAGLADHQNAEELLLVRVVMDDDARVRVVALRSLGLVGGTASAQVLLKLVRDHRAETAVRAQGLYSLGLLARRGSTSVLPALPVALKLLETASVPVEVRRGAAYLVATLVGRFAQARAGLNPARRKLLGALLAKARDPEIRLQLGRVAVRLRMLTPAELATLIRRGGTDGREAVPSLLKRDSAKGTVTGPLLAALIKDLPKAVCATGQPVVLWQLLEQLASQARRPWVAKAAPGWFAAIVAARGQVPAKSCGANQLARLACQAAVVADQAGQRVKRLPGCGGGELTPDAEGAFLAAALGSGQLGRRPWRRLRRLYVSGREPTRVAALLAAAKLGGDDAHALVSRGLASKSLAVLGAAVEACVALGKAPAKPGQGPVKHSCLVAVRARLLKLPTPPTFDDLPLWIELLRAVRGLADNPVVERLRLAARHHHPTLRALARAALEAVLGRAPAVTTWPADRRRPPAEPLRKAVELKIETPLGAMTLRLRPDWAPVTAAYYLNLVRQGKLSGSSFHRVVPGFVVQGGDETGTGFGGDTSLMLSEWSDARFARGVVGVAHAGKDTEGSQLFITLGAAPHLDGRYTAFGEITSGLELVDRLLPGAFFRVVLPGSPAPRVRPAPQPMQTPVPPMPQPKLQPMPQPMPASKPQPRPMKRKKASKKERKK